MILYSVYINDVECPKLVFQTYQRKKAENFVNKYNKINVIDYRFDNAFISTTELSPEIIEEKANLAINEYKEYFRIQIKFNPNGSYEILRTSKHYDENYSLEYYDSYLDTISGSISDYKKIVLTEQNLQKFLDLPNEKVVERIKKVIKEWDSEFSSES